MIHHYLPEGLLLSATENGLPLPISDWIFLAEDQVVGSLAWHLWASEQEGAKEHPDGLLLLTSCLDHLEPAEAKILGVSHFSEQLTITENGPVSFPSYQWNINWGMPLMPQGCWADIQGQPLFLSIPYRRLLELCKTASTANADSRFRAIADLHALARTFPAAIRLAGSLGARRILQVDAIQVDIENDPLLGPLPVAIPAFRQGDGLLKTELSAPELIQLRSKAGSAGGRIPLNISTTVLVSPQAAANMYLTGMVRQATPEVRAEFLQNPASYLPFEEAFDEDDYSERVIGIGKLPPPQARAASGLVWTPDEEGFWLEAGHQRCWVSQDEVPELLNALRDAQGQSELWWRGLRLPVPTDLELLKKQLARPRTEQSAHISVPILLIRENAWELSYAAWRQPPRSVCDDVLPTLKIPLQPHQTEGVRRLQQLWQDGYRGALLCDDMGLGKTLQGLVFAAWVTQQAQTVDIPVMIVAPLSLLDTWLAELERSLDPKYFPIILWGHAEGAPGVPTRRSILPLNRYLTRRGGGEVVVQGNCFDLEGIRTHRPTLLMTSYDSLRRYQFSFGKLRFGLILADEAQAIKNDHSLRSRALRAMNYDFGLSLTGTPIENQWADLWTLCDYSLPGRLGTRREFLATYPEDGDPAETGPRLATALKEVLVRRTRAEAIPGLPMLHRHQPRVLMGQEQQLAYDLAAALPRQGKGSGLALLQDLARVSLHPRLSATPQSQAEVAAWVGGSARLSAAWPWLKRWQAEGRAVLVFARLRAAQRGLAQAIELDFGVKRVPILSGEVKAAERSALVETLARQTGFRVLILSPDVGGVGWNLQFASRALILERPFNPAVEAQMLARIHRLGQREEVEVVTPVATHSSRRSFDEVLDKLLYGKLDLATSVLVPLNLKEEEILVGLR